ncbi:MAG: DUF4861 family protein [Ginsengibacter sp.]
MNIFLAGAKDRSVLKSGYEKYPILISIKNPYKLNREELVSIPVKELISHWKDFGKKEFKVVNADTKKEIPYQLEYLGNKEPVNLLLQINIEPEAQLNMGIIMAAPTAVSPKTFARYVPERKDDFAWENDRIAFRMYGKALEGTKEDAYGLDVWLKRTDRLILNERYKRGEYHIDHGDGLDYYHVGFSLGAGNIAPYINDSIWFSKNYHRYEVLDNGPLRSTFRLFYDEWNVAGQPVSVTKTISLDAGSQLNKMAIQYNFKENILPVAVGIIKRIEKGAILLAEQKGVMAYWEPAHGNDGITGVGCVLPDSVKEMKVDKKHLLSIAEVKPNHIYIYYTGAAWNKAGLITNEKEWFEYLENFAEKLKHPLEITFVNSK